MAHTHIIGQNHDDFVQAQILNDISFQYKTLNGKKHPRKIFVLDPIGQTIDWLLLRVPNSRIKDVLYFDPRQPMDWNPLHSISDIPAVASSVVDTFRAINGYEISANLFNKALYSAVSALLETGGTLFDVKYFLLSDNYRKRVLDKIDNPVIKRFWQKEYIELSPREKGELIRSAETTFHILISDPRIAEMLAHRTSTVSLADIEIFLASIPQGNFGIQRSATIGSLLLGQLLSTVQRHPYSDLRVYILDAHTFAPSPLIQLLNSGHKFGVNSTLAHQTLSQLDYRLKDAILGNCETRHVFRVSLADATELESLTDHDNTNPHLNELAPSVYRTYPVADRLHPDRPVVPFSTVPKEKTRSRIETANQKYRKHINLKQLLEHIK